MMPTKPTEISQKTRFRVKTSLRNSAKPGNDLFLSISLIKGNRKITHPDRWKQEE